ncbi:hypothetical protein JQX09_17950 [Sulfitobacter pseudonitzschiae]|uniref:Uncharacterized protein n=1 Tax=Pseudosulfitobacter pseudonitzschiae TaxID=1402135 RepID=A0A9Q2RWV2_9RHOB|nr:hypothetical protein [Pseudosulfitobacter pseudonitzschiae]MBM2293815.1 hypothetical protein [Pseudosulfitobacter pseudonitzschiae]MBM2298732.1 hypothetical protein [Pseudosulfitobacter pseudonitzschiae]MBM2303647.1 hypothetical protein [Pseudosulfitobacter pseudonitzschiae]MBM2313429.1 hypothetical protein [Pseudosulfitobacter pseudonitzschiae]MBM2318343.1 hypothetical protein [Pseudosulfitobacter pseudonitzschiae]
MNETTTITADETETANTALALPAKADLQKSFEDGSIDQLIGRIEVEVRSHAPDLSTAKGRKEITSLAYKVARSKTPLDEARKALTEDWRKKTAKVNEHWKSAESRLNDLRDEVAKPLKDWEAAEEARKAAHRERLTIFNPDRSTFSMAADEIQAVIDEVENTPVDDSWEEFEEPAASAKIDAMAKHRANLEAATIREAQERQIAKLQEEAAAREAKEAEERAKREQEEADRKAETDRLAAEEQERQDKLRAEELEKQREADRLAEEEERAAQERARKVLAARDLMDHISGCGKGMIGPDAQPFGLLFYELEQKVPAEILKLLDEDQARVEQHRAATLEVLKEKAEIQRQRNEERRAEEAKQAEAAAAEKARKEEAERRAKQEADEKAAADKRRADKEHREKILSEVTVAMKAYAIEDLAQAMLDGKIPHVKLEI